MQIISKNLVAVVILAASVGGANAGAIIQNSQVQLGVDDYGQLNVGGGTPATGDVLGTTTVGIRSVQTNSDSTSPGCLCEGWGIGIRSSGIYGSANNNWGVENLVLKSFSSTASTAESVVDVLARSGTTGLQVTHDYSPIAGTPYLYQVLVSITNLTGVDLAARDLVYRRVMDWDVPTPGAEAVTIQGIPAALGLANGSNLYYASNNGFALSNPLTVDPQSTFPFLENQNFSDQRGDTGALFDFEFGALANGASLTFTTYYGWAPSKAAADSARSAVNGDPSDVDIGLYSYGACGDESRGCNGATGVPDTFIFGFGAVGGKLLVPTEPNAVPEPHSMALVGIGLIAAVGLSRRRRIAPGAMTAV